MVNIISIIDNKYSQLIDNIKTPMENYINEHVTKNINEMKEDNIKMKNSQEIINTKVVEYINKLIFLKIYFNYDYLFDNKLI